MRYSLARWTASVTVVALMGIGARGTGTANGQVGPAPAQQSQASPPTLTLRVRLANASGQLPAMTGVSGPAMDGGDALLMVGTEGHGELCGSQGLFAVTGSAGLPASVAGSHVWHVSARVLRVDLDRVSFAVDLERYRRQAGGYEAVLRETRTVTLREEQWAPIDAVTVPPEQRGACGVATAVLEASAEFVKSAADRSGAIDYELWLVDRGSTPIEPQRRLGTRGSGEVWEFRFGTISQPLGACVAQTTVSGTVRARELGGGQIEVLLAPARWIGQKLPTERGVGSPDEDAGRKVVRMRSGVAVEFRLPPPSARVIGWEKWEPCGESTPGQSLFAHQVASQSLALILTVSPAPGSDISAR